MKKIFILFLVLLLYRGHAQPGCTTYTDVAGGTAQPGLYAEYFAGYHNENTSFFPNAISSTNRIEANLNYTTSDFGVSTPPASGTATDQDNFSARYRGSIYIATAGTYTFYLTSDDGSYMWIDTPAFVYPAYIPNALINNGGGHGAITVSGAVFLNAGYHPIQIQYGEGCCGNSLVFEYEASSPSIPRQVVPGSVLCTGTPPIFIPVFAPPPGCTTYTDVAGNSAQAGLYAEYFAGYHNENTSFFPNAISSTNRIEANLNYTTSDFGVSTPPASGTATDQDNFSARYRGSIYIATAGTYTFYLTSDDGSYMWIDNPALAYPASIPNAFINNGGGHGAITVSGAVFLNAGYYPIQIQYGDGVSGNSLVLEYEASSPSISRQLIPGSILCTGMEQTATLPVELLNFSAIKNADSKVLLTWETASEVNNKQFDIERSSNGIDFITIGTVPAKGSGTSTKTNLYKWVDFNPGYGILYYRLRQVDKNTSSKLYKIVSVELDEVSPVTFRIFPNPNQGTFEMSVAGVSANSRPEIAIHTIDGREVYYTSIDPSSIENNKAILKVTPGIAKGLYIANCMVNGVKFPVKLVIK